MDISKECERSTMDADSQQENRMSPDIVNAFNGFPSTEIKSEDTASEKGNSIYVEDKGPYFRKVRTPIVTPPIDPKKLPEAFSSILLPGKLEFKDDLSKFQTERIKAYVASDLNDKDIATLAAICDVKHLRTGQELVMSTDYPTLGQVSNEEESIEEISKNNLSIIKKYKERVLKDDRNLFHKRLRYRGIKLIPPPCDVKPDPKEEPLEPGKDIIFRIRVYRPFKYEKHNRGRHSVLSCDVVMLGRQSLVELRDRIVCANDVSIKIDVSEDRHNLVDLLSPSREMFPSGMLFINNVFYVDDRAGCIDYSKPIRDWCEDKMIGTFPKVDMSTVKMQDLIIKLGHPDVFIHQGNCEHLFVFSELRLLNATDPLSRSAYPYNTMVSQLHALYCTTCAEFGAKWIVIHSDRLPFDPSFFCESCLNSYMYVNNKKLGNFKLYAFRGNQLCLSKQLCEDLTGDAVGDKRV